MNMKRFIATTGADIFFGSAHLLIIIQWPFLPWGTSWEQRSGSKKWQAWQYSEWKKSPIWEKVEKFIFVFYKKNAFLLTAPHPNQAFSVMLFQCLNCPCLEKKNRRRFVIMTWYHQAEVKVTQPEKVRCFSAVKTKVNSLLDLHNQK